MLFFCSTESWNSYNILVHSYSISQKDSHIIVENFLISGKPWICSSELKFQTTLTTSICILTLISWITGYHKFVVPLGLEKEVRLYQMNKLNIDTLNKKYTVTSSNDKAVYL